MIGPVQQFRKMAATLLLAFALAVVGISPMKHQMAEASETTVSESGMPCANMSGHATTDISGAAPDHDSSSPDRCCGGTLCTGYTLSAVSASPAPLVANPVFAKTPPEALRVADIALPKRPPRIL